MTLRVDGRALALLFLTVCAGGCTPTGVGDGITNDNTAENNNTNGNVNDNQPDNANTNDNTAVEATGTFDQASGLQLEAGAFELEVLAQADPSNATITMRILAESELAALGLPAGNGFEHGVSFEPNGTIFATPVEVRVDLASPTTLEALAVLRYDETAGTWGDSGVSAVVENDGTRARFELSGFSDYDLWNPPLPPGDLPIGDGEIIAGTGLFEGQPFNVFPGYTNTSASLTYSDFGDVFGLALINVDLENPTTGDLITLTAGLHATEVRRLDEGVILGLVTPAGGLGGVSLYSDGTPSFAKPLAGVMYLRKTATQWKVDVYCHYEGGLIFGQAVGDR